MSDEAALRTPELTQTLMRIAEEFGLEAMEDPYDYVKTLQQEIDDSKIRYTDEYYDVLGIQREGMEDETDVDERPTAEAGVCFTWEE